MTHPILDITSIKRFINKIEQAIFRDETTTISQMNALMCLLDHGGLTAGNIAIMLNISKSAVSMLMHTLENEGMVIRSFDRFDRRLVLYSLTEEGIVVTNRLRKKRSLIIQKTLSPLLTPGEISELNSIFSKLIIKK
ncbi:MarR family winged helix-turn-helix transcriptional regulator [Fictibacillus barbaricus]|uniref:MarR family transcriptional regulator n=1 Tax=Fictibacillus barbaricus TaxID=182136 RepID=A0ABS2Z7T4_9BACL|nr:MarR family transcriptional regulator [Fictibacillus barbaricus]MBN3544132.1 MarR family transcriptional regulator [Fictibacillus barbaricus]GGB69179.1 hypothetical protein GCM10007199_39230 [Fictibacillus barbaricus]